MKLDALANVPQVKAETTMFKTRISFCYGVSLEVRFCLLWEHRQGDNLVTILSLFLAKNVG